MRKVYIAFWGVLILLLLYGGYRWALREAMEGELAAIRAAGYPATPAELEASRPVLSDEENAAVLLEEAFWKYVDPTGDALLEKNLPWSGDFSDGPPKLGEPMPEVMKQALRQFLDENEEALQLLDRLPDHPRARFDVDYSGGYKMSHLYDHYSKLREATGMMADRAIWRAEVGDAEGAIGSLRTFFAVGRCLDEEPAVIFWLVGMSIRTSGIYNVQWVMNRCDISEEQLKALAVMLPDDSELVESFKRALIGERVSTLSYRRMSAGELGETLVNTEYANDIVGWLVKASGMFELNLLKHSSGYGQLIAYLALPASEWLNRTLLICDDLQQYMESAWALGTSGLFRLGPYPYKTKFMLAAMERAKIRLARAAIAVERYRLKHDALPGKLDDLVGEFLDAVPLDPFDGKALRYERRGEGFVVYSIGEDRMDDGGVGDLSRTVDIVFTVRAAAVDGGGESGEGLQ